MRTRQERRAPALFPQALFSQALGLTATAAGCFALGAWAGSHLPTGIALVSYLAAGGCLLALPFAAHWRGRAGFATALTLLLGVSAGLALARTASYYAVADPRIIWQAGGIAGLVTAACACARYLALARLAMLTRILLAEALAIALCGMVLMSEYMAIGSIGWAAIASVAYVSLVIGGMSLIRRSRDFTSAQLLAASVFAAPADIFFLLVWNSVERACDAAFRRQAGIAPGPARSRS